MDDSHTNSAVTRERFKQSLRQVVWISIQQHWKGIASFLLGAVGGMASAYLAIWIQISDARHASADALAATGRLESQLNHLATRDQVDAVNRRIDDWQYFLSQKAEEPPNSRKRRRPP